MIVKQQLTNTTTTPAHRILGSMGYKPAPKGCGCHHCSAVGAMWVKQVGPWEFFMCGVCQKTREVKTG